MLNPETGVVRNGWELQNDDDRRSVSGMGNTEILAQAMKFVVHLKEVEASHLPRRFGKPTGANILVILRAFCELFKLWWKLEYIHSTQEGIFERARGKSESVDAPAGRLAGAQDFDVQEVSKHNTGVSRGF